MDSNGSRPALCCQPLWTAHFIDARSPPVLGCWDVTRDAKGKMTSHILVSSGLLPVSRLHISLRTHELGDEKVPPQKQQPQQPSPQQQSPAPAAPVCPLGFLGYLLDPCRCSKLNLKPRQSEQGELEGKRGGV